MIVLLARPARLSICISGIIAESRQDIYGRGLIHARDIPNRIFI
jgi:hypothetical protein